MRRKILSLVIVMLSVTLLSACGKSNVTTANNKEGVSGEEKKYKIGVIQFMDHVSLDAANEGFVNKLKESGLNVDFVVENTNGDISLTTTIPQKLVSEKVDLIYAIATPAVQGAKNTVSDIPVVFSAVTDPIGAGLVESIEKPSTNVTGVSDYMDPRVQIDSFLKIYPNIKTFGTIYNTGEQNSIVQVEELEKVLNEKDMKLVKVGISTVNDIPQAIASIAPKIDALFALTDNTVASAAPIVAENLGKYKLPSLSAEEGQVSKGLLMSEGVDYYEQGKQAAEIAIKILNGEKPESIPVEYNKVNDRKINKDTAKLLGLDLDSESFKNMTIIENK